MGLPPWGRKRQYVYFILARQVRSVKVGLSNNPQARLEAIRTSCPVELELLGFFKGNWCDEYEIKKALEEYRIRGEWFGLCDAVRNFVIEFIGEAGESLFEIPDNEEFGIRPFV